MRYRLMATYLGVPYHAGLGPDGTDMTLFSPGPPPEDLGFTAAAGHWRKQVRISDLSALWQSRLVGEYRGEPCLVLDDLGERLHIVYLGRDAMRARQLGYWEIDREVFEVVVARDEVAGLTEERVEFPLASATFPPSSPGSGSPPPTADPVPGTGPLSGTGPLPRVFSSAAAFPPPGPPPGPEPEPDTLIQGRLDARGRLVGRAQAEATGPRPRMEPAGSQAPAGPAGYSGTDRGPRTTDRAAAWHGSPASEPWPAPEPRPEPRPGPPARPEPENAPPPGRRTARRDRVSPQSVFAELLSLAGIPQTAYAVDEEVPGAMCLVKADGGVEVFSCTQDARLEVHFFEDEEAAYFYLFGVLAAEAIHSRRLGPIRSNESANGSREAGDGMAAKAAREDVSKYLRSGNLPKSPSRPASLNKPAGLTVPRSPSSPVGLPDHRSANRIRPVEKESLFALLSNRYRFSRPPRYFRHVEPGRRYLGAISPYPVAVGNTVVYVSGPLGPPPAADAPTATAGVASLAVRDLLRGARRPGKVLAALPEALYLEFADTVPEPRVIAISPPDAIRLPNAIITGPWEAPPAVDSEQCWAGGDRVLAGRLDIRIVRWWDPSPVFGPLSRARLDHGHGVLARLCAAAEQAPGLAGQDDPAQLAACCGRGDLAGAVEATERLVGLGPGLIPSGDSMVSGVLLALRLLGGAISGGTRAVWLANWLSASATCYAGQRTTTLGASLLHCAANGQAAAEVSAVLLGMAGQEPLEPPAAKLLAAVPGADLAWGLVAGCRAALLLSVSLGRDRSAYRVAVRD